MNAKLLLAALLIPVSFAPLVGAHAACAFADGVGACATAGSWGSDCSSYAANGADASVWAPGVSREAYAQQSCESYRGGWWNETYHYEDRAVRAGSYGSTFGTEDRAFAGWERYRYEGPGYAYEGCQVYVESANGWEPHACPADLAPPAVPTLLP